MYFFTVELDSLNDNNSFPVFPMGRINKHGLLITEGGKQPRLGSLFETHLGSLSLTLFILPLH